MARLVSRRWRSAGILVGLALLALPVSIAVASSSSVAKEIQIGPLTVGHGYKLTISGSCNEPHAHASVTLVKTGPGYTFTHYYNDYDGNEDGSICKTANNLRSGFMGLSWGSLLSAKLNFSKAGRLKGYSVQGCRGTFGYEREVTGQGTFKMAIHTGVFGKLDLRTVKGEIRKLNGSCVRGPTTATALGASWGNYIADVSAYTSPRGHRFLAVSAPDNPSPFVSGSAEDVFEGKSLFSFGPNLSSAELKGFDPFVTGSLHYEASSACAYGFTTGKLSGKLVLHDPVSGTRRFVGRRASAPVELDGAHGKC